MIIHNNTLRVNADVPDGVDMDVYRDMGWVKGPHKDSDPDDRSPVPRVLPLPEPDPEPAKAKAKADTKET